MDAEISPEEVRELLESDEEVRVVDIRPERAFEQAHIPDSENVPFHALADEIERFDGAERIVTVCPHGKSSVQAARLVSSYEGVPADARVASMAGGLDEWEWELDSGASDSTADGSDGADEESEDDSKEAAEGPDAPF